MTEFVALFPRRAVWSLESIALYHLRGGGGGGGRAVPWFFQATNVEFTLHNFFRTLFGDNCFNFRVYKNAIFCMKWGLVSMLANSWANNCFYSCKYFSPVSSVFLKVLNSETNFFSRKNHRPSQVWHSPPLRPTRVSCMSHICLYK